MGRYREAKCRLCRAYGEKLFLKGTRCTTEKCPVVRRPFAPGQHGKIRKKESNYGLQLKEKQKAKRIYGILEQQFKNYFKKAEQKRGVTGEILLQLLERRLDNVVFRANYAYSRMYARQLVRHGHVCVNGRKIDIPSYQLNIGDVIEIRGKDSFKKRISEICKELKDRLIPKWIEQKPGELKLLIKSLPQREDIDFTIKEQLIVELYSK